MKAVILRVLPLILLAITINVQVCAQEDGSSNKLQDYKDRAEKSIISMMNGSLVVRLPGQFKKIEALEKLLQSSSLTEKEQAQTSKILKETIHERDTFNRRMMVSMRKYYQFTPLYFMYDSAQAHLTNGVKSGIFLNSNLQPEPMISLQTEDYFIMHYGFTNRDNTAGLEAWIISDSKLKDLERPFPYFIGVKGFPKKERKMKFDPESNEWVYIKRKPGEKRKKFKGTDRIAVGFDSRLKMYALAVLSED